MLEARKLISLQSWEDAIEAPPPTHRVHSGRGFSIKALQVYSTQKVNKIADPHSFVMLKVIVRQHHMPHSMSQIPHPKCKDTKHAIPI